jgi:hypothetical protein
MLPTKTDLDGAFVDIFLVARLVSESAELCEVGEQVHEGKQCKLLLENEG